MLNVLSLSDALHDAASLIKNYFTQNLSGVRGYVQIGIIGALVFLLVLFFILAIIFPKKRKKTEKTKVKSSASLEELRSERDKIAYELAVEHAAIADAEKKALDDIAALTESEKTLCESELALDAHGKDRISELAIKQRMLEDLLHRQQCGILNSMNREDLSATERVLTNVEAEQQEHEREISQRQNDRSRRAELLEINVTEVNKQLERLKADKKARIDSLSARLDELDAEIHALTYSYDKKKSRKKRKEYDADEVVKSTYKLSDEELKALEELRIAKEEYELACKRRIQAEKNKQIAVENAKAEYEERRKAQELVKKSSKTLTTQNSPIDQLEQPPVDTEDVQLIIADLNGDGTLEITDEPIKPENQTAATEDETTQSATPDNDGDDYEQISFDDEVIFSEASVEEINYDEQAKVGFTGIIDNDDSDTIYAPLPTHPSEEITATDTRSADENHTQTQHPKDSVKVENKVYIDGFSPDEPENLWKIVRQGEKFVAFLTVDGRKIAHTDGYQSAYSARTAIKNLIATCEKRKPETIQLESGKYSFKLTAANGKTLLHGEKLRSKTKSESDALLVIESINCPIKTV